MLNSPEHWEFRCVRCSPYPSKAVGTYDSHRAVVWVVSHCLQSQGYDLLGRPFTGCNHFDIAGSSAGSQTVARVNFSILFNRDNGHLDEVLGLKKEPEEGVFPWSFFTLFVEELGKRRIPIDTLV